MQETLEKLITEIVKNLEDEKLDERIDFYNNYKTRYVVLKPSVKVRVELTEGKIAEIDVTDYFEGVVR